jgi:hypothetical protein
MKQYCHRLFLISLTLCLGVSCTTAYDQYGRPRQVVEPGAALIGAAAVGLLAYSLANNNDNRHRSNGCNQGYYHNSGFRGRNLCY